MKTSWLILTQKFEKIKEIAENLEISVSSMKTIIKDGLKLTKMSDRWVHLWSLNTMKRDWLKSHKFCNVMKIWNQLIKFYINLWWNMVVLLQHRDKMNRHQITTSKLTYTMENQNHIFPWENHGYILLGFKSNSIPWFSHTI